MRTMSKVILISGFKRSGKDTFGALLVDELEKTGQTAETISFAAPMKKILAVVLGISEETLDERKNDSRFPHRGYLQRLGTEAIKPIFGDSVWTDLAIAEAKRSEMDYVVVTDFRFPEETSGWPEDVYTIRVDRKEVTPQEGFQHSSETALKGFKFNEVVPNNGTLQELREAASQLITRI